MLNILILATLPQEYASLKKMIPARFRLINRKPFKQFEFGLPDKEIRLIETGMGEECVEKALKWAFARRIPDLLIFAGFCGGLHTELQTGDVCIVERTGVSPASGDRKHGVFAFRFPDELRIFLAERRIKSIESLMIATPVDKATFCPGPKDKRRDSESPQPLAAVDMETHALAAIAYREQLPFLCFRSVSDELNHEIGFALEDITGPEGKVKMCRVLKTILLHPRTIKAFFLAWRRSVKAGRSLCAALAAFLALSGVSLGHIARGIGIERE